MLTRSYLSERSSKSLLAYSPMFHARLFTETQKFREAHFQPMRKSPDSEGAEGTRPWLDGNPNIDRPLFVQFCANKPDELLEAARYVETYCDAVDLNLGCPQGIARSGHYGAFLQEDWDTIYKLINKLHTSLSVPVTAKMRILESKERTLEYAKMILSAGASIITVHGRRREQKGHNMGTADWSYIRYLRDHLPPEAVIFANGNILNRNDIQPCLIATGADGVMSAEGNLSDPTVFAEPPAPGMEDQEYWRGRDGQHGYRIDGVFRRYMDIIHRQVLEVEPPPRPPLFVPADKGYSGIELANVNGLSNARPTPSKKRKREKGSNIISPNLKAMQGHLFQLLRPMLATHTDIRDALARCCVGDIAAFENVLNMVEKAIGEALEEDTKQQSNGVGKDTGEEEKQRGEATVEQESVVNKYKKPWWICQPYIRPLPEEAIKIGALTVSKKERKRLQGDTPQLSSGRIGGDDSVYAELAEPQVEVHQSTLVCG
jgi:tRNA-dihydrouridine synthase 1